MKKRIFYPVSCITAFFIQACTYNNIEPPVDCSSEGPSLDLIEVGDADCNQQNGFIQVAATGGTGSYQFKLNEEPFQDEKAFSGLGAGTYLITLKDGNTCEQAMSVNVLNKDGVNVSLSGTVAGCKESDGSITAESEGGEAPFLYKIGDGNFQDNNVFDNLSAGNYTITIKDNTGCETNQSIKLHSGISFNDEIKPIIENSCAINSCHNGNQFPDFRQFNNIQSNAAKIKELTGNKTMPDEGTLTQNQIDAIACWVDDGALAN
jgi:SprB repeat